MCCTDQSLFLQQWSIAIKDKHWPDAEKQQLADAVEEREKVRVLDTVAITVSDPFHGLIEPNTDIYCCQVKVHV